MDSEFEQRWRNGNPPFNALTVTFKDYVSLPLFRQALAAVIERLYDYRPEASLLRLLDWHEHDGFVGEAKPYSWQELRALVASAEALTACFHRGDTYVREGFFPAERDYYLRFYVPDPSDSPYPVKTAEI